MIHYIDDANQIYSILTKSIVTNKRKNKAKNLLLVLLTMTTIYQFLF